MRKWLSIDRGTSKFQILTAIFPILLTISIQIFGDLTADWSTNFSDFIVEIFDDI